MNVQFVITRIDSQSKVYILEVNPRGSRTVPFLSKVTGIPMVDVAVNVMLGKSLKEQGYETGLQPAKPLVAIKAPVFSMSKLIGVDTYLGPEMKSTGEVMGIDDNFGSAFMKSQIAAGQNLPLKGKVFISVKDKDKRSVMLIAKKLSDLGFSLIATHGTAEALKNNGLDVRPVHKIGTGKPDVADLIKKGEIQLIINTPSGKVAKQDEIGIRAGAYMHNIPLITTISGAQAAVNGIDAAKKKGFGVKALQDYYH
jgi:carbamoyl-phosphate synthase large subunit